ncbi:MAG TPA: type II toxin-antitoxin system HipA family toxin YjjJ [Bacteroidia bacterium]|nr:type II toxin-antitoxin system HipA family toxin YjjJ [Bacteroidia bacterium]
MTPLLMARGPVSATELAAALRVDRSTVVRALSRFGNELATFGATRSTRYALRRTVFPMGNRWPVYRIGETGRARLWATLESYHDRRWRVVWPDAETAPVWADRFLDADGMWEGFPFFLADIRPQGFLGRTIARHLPRLLGLPEDPRLWSDDDTLLYLQAEGDDPPGALVVGEECLRRALSPPSGEAVPEQDRPARYAALASTATEVAPGSSAGGEQPKFLARVIDGSGTERPVIVKFTPPVDQTTGQRWADLLACEGLASEILAGHGLTSHGTTVLDADGRRFLESSRFDRTDGGGRRGVVSLSALHPEANAYGAAAWTRAAGELEADGLIDSETRSTIQQLHAFGDWIGNSDRHAGNLAFWLDDTLPFRLAPAYDMLPMLWAPGPQGEIVERTFSPPPPLPGEEGTWLETAGWALEFWERAADLAGLSDGFRQIARNAAELVQRSVARFG